MEFYKEKHKDERYDYTVACDYLAGIGLNPDPNYLHEGKPYKYGSAWLRREVPQEAIDFLLALPDADKKPAWI